ncbi:MAG: D-alanyl-D-alanine carboxypeptidase [Bacilli bacterium]|nr:D-alanyl-D-alanine carboxypeptidase [Bacilli bacterium]
MKKRIILIIILLFPIYIEALEYPSINSKVVEIYDMTDNKVIYEVDSNKASSIASLTKIATTITAIEEIDNLDEKVTITNEILKTVRWDASKAGLKAGDVLTYRDLLYASILPSGADATNSVAILSSGSIENFVKKMNELIKKIGLTNTNFVNVTGLDENNHYSTASDIRKLLAYSLKNPTFKEIYTAKDYTLSNGLKVESTIKRYSNSNLNTNNILGSKTGYTGEAGYCFSSLSNINSHEFIIVVLNADKINNNYYNVIDTVNLIAFLNNNFKEELLVKKKTLIKELPVELSNIDKYQIKATKDIKKYLPSDYNINNLNIEYKGLEKLNYKNKINEEIGVINYYYDNELFDTEKVIINKVIKIDYIKVLKKYYYVIIILLFIPIIILLTKKRKRLKSKK